MSGRTVVLLLMVFLAPACALGADQVEIRRLPDGAVQPRLASNDGVIHLVYFQPEAKGSRFGILMHTTLATNEADFDEAVPVSSRFRHNDQIGKADLAIDGDGRVHIAWFQTGPLGYFYTRSVDGGETFSAPRALVSDNLEGVETEPSVAADGNRVTVAWHAGNMREEDQRRVYVVMSRDGGETFSEEIAASQPGLGVCACCAMASSFDADGNYTLAYRSAIGGTGRHMQVMNDGRTGSVGDWELDYCPVTSADMLAGWLAFETDGRVYRWHAEKQSQAEPVTASAPRARQKHPAVAVNEQGDVLIVWGEAGGYFTGGEINMAIVSNAELAETEVPAGTIPEFSVVSAVARPNGTFLVVY